MTRGTLPWYLSRRGRWITLGLFAAALFANRLWPTDRSRERDVLRAFDRITSAWRERDFERVWDLLSRERQEAYAADLAEWKAKAPDPDRGMRTWCMKTKFEGVRPEESLSMTPKEWYLAHLRRLRGSGAQDYANTIRILDDLEIGRVSFTGERALLYGDTSERVGTLLAEFRLEGGEWRLDDAVWDTRGFNTLERKVACYLPKGLPRLVPASRFSMVLRIGPQGVAADDVPALRKLAARQAKDERGALVDLSPEATHQDLIRVIDVLIAEGLTDVYFASPPDEPIPPGITANGVPLAAALAGPLPPVPEDDPALSRVLGIRQE